MRYWFDTEFIEDGKTIDLISIGIVAEDGREYYAINYDCDFSKASTWVKENVLAKLPPSPLPQYHQTTQAWKKSEACQQGWRNKRTISFEIMEFLKSPEVGQIELSYQAWHSQPLKESPEIWGYYPSSDWVAFYQLFGTLMDLPDGFPKRCNDIKQECDRLGNPQLPEKPKDSHNALVDAKWNKRAWEFLRRYEQNPRSFTERMGVS